MRVLIFILFPVFSFAQPTYFGSATNPADAGTLATATVAITPPASMLAGDLVIIYASARSTTTTFSVLPA